MELTISQDSYISEKDQQVLDEYMDLVEQAKSGYIEAKDVYADLHVLLKSLKELQDEIKDQAIDELERYTRDDVVERNGFKMSVVSSKRYSYKHDDSWNAWKEQMKDREELMKQVALKSIELYDENGAEIPAAEIKFSTYIKMEKA